MLGMGRLITVLLKNNGNLIRTCHTRYRKKPMHGSRYLVNKTRVFEFNAWYVLYQALFSTLEYILKT